MKKQRRRQGQAALPPPEGSPEGAAGQGALTATSTFPRAPARRPVVAPPARVGLLHSTAAGAGAGLPCGPPHTARVLHEPLTLETDQRVIRSRQPLDGLALAAHTKFRRPAPLAAPSIPAYLHPCSLLCHQA